jgi:two-component system response regulator FixJ
MLIPSPDLPTVFVVDDDRDMRDSLVTLIQALGYPVRAFASAAEFDAAHRPELSGCLVLDIRMPGESGLALYERLLLEGRTLPVIFITAHADVSTAVAAMKTGAIDFLEKPFDRRHLIEKIDKALALDAEWRRRRLRFQHLDERVGRLSRVDRETLDLLIEGAPNKSMAVRLGVTERAVELRRQRLMQRLGVHSLAELLDLTITHRVLAEVDQVARQRPFAED